MPAKRDKIVEISALAFNKNFFEFRKNARFFANKGFKNLHFDVMDNTFVKNKSFPNLEHLDFLIKSKFAISVHLMVEDVEKFVQKLVYKKVSYVTFHCEVFEDDEKPIELMRFLRHKNIKAGIAIAPKTNILEKENLIKKSDVITVMSVEPGWGGQKYLEGSTERLIQVRKLAYEDTLIQLDGGLDDEKMLLNKDYADLFVSGSYLFKNYHKYEEIKRNLAS